MRSRMSFSHPWTTAVRTSLSEALQVGNGRTTVSSRLRAQDALLLSLELFVGQDALDSHYAFRSCATGPYVA